MFTEYRRVVLTALSLAVLGSLSAPGCSRRSRPNVLWITVDSLRPDHLGCYGYQPARTPAIDRLAEAGFLFQTCVAQAPYTHLSVPSMITGRYPRLAGVKTAGHNLAADHTTLAEILREAGYHTTATPMGWKEGFNQGFERLFPVTRSSQRKTRWCLQALAEEDERPFFIWLYYWDPHLPYEPPRQFMRLFEPDYEPGERTSRGRPRRDIPDEQLRDPSGHYAGRIEVLNRINEGRIGITAEERGHLINLYDAEVAMVDAEISRVLDELRKRDLWNNTLVVLNADHGEGFGEHGLYYHGLSLYEDQIRVPLIFKPPGMSPEDGTIGGAVRNLDIMPTILEYCDLTVPGGLDGQTLRPFIERGSAPRLPSCLETSGSWKGAASTFQLAGLRREGLKLIVDPLTERWELYALDDDPGEERNLLEGPVGEDLREKEAALREELFSTLGVDGLDELRLSRRERQMDQATTQRLRALGYID
jgi:arylsulfatase A-like enzyme